jgi:hypothetical protein
MVSDMDNLLQAQRSSGWFESPAKGDVRVMTGYDYFGRSQDGYGVLSGYDDQAQSLYLMADRKYGEWMRYGIGAEVSFLESDYKKNGHRQEAIIQVLSPLTFKLSEELSLASVPRLGIGFGDYKRMGGSEEYKGDIRNYYYGVSNELRYEIDAGLLSLEPVAEFNILGLYHDGYKERGGITSRIEMEAGNNVSVEGGLGLYAKKEFRLDEMDILKFRVGGSYYHEMNNVYEGSRAHVSGMSGGFRMAGYEAERNRGVLSLQASWEHDLLSLYFSVSQFVEKDAATQFNAGVRYRWE